MIRQTGLAGIVCQNLAFATAFYILSIEPLAAQKEEKSGNRSGYMARLKELEGKSLKVLSEGTLKEETIKPSDSESTNERPIRVLRLDSKVKLEELESVLRNSAGDQMAFAIWARTIEDGRTGQAVNLSNHRWKPKDKFRLYIRAAVPLYLSIHQQTDSGLVQRHPDPKKNPSGLSPIMPSSTATALGDFQMDNDDMQEHMVIRVQRFDTVKLPDQRDDDDHGGKQKDKDKDKDHGSGNNGQSNDDKGKGKGKVKHSGDNEGENEEEGTTKGQQFAMKLNHRLQEAAAKKEPGEAEKFVPLDDTSNEPDDVAWVFLSNGKSAEHRLNLNK